MNIADYIPVGKENAITSEKLSFITGMSDRKIRNEIAKARRKTCILNFQNGKGYYKPDETNEDDKVEVKRYINQERHRALSILYSLNGAKEYYNEITGQVEFELIEGSEDLSISLSQ